MGPRLLIALVLAQAITGACATRDQPPPISPPADESAVGRRYAAQMPAYIAGSADAPVWIQFALIDQWEQMAPPEPAIQQFFWLTDRGKISAAVENAVASAVGDQHRLTTVVSRVDRLEPQQYLLTGIEYADAAGDIHQLGVGDIMIDVRDVVDPAPIDFPEHTSGAFRLDYIQVRARNTADQPVTVTGIEFDLPGAPTDVHMFIAGGSVGGSGDASQRPEVAPSPVAVTTVEIQPGEFVDIRFDVVTAEEGAVRFGQLAPFLTVETNAGVVSVPVPLQVYFPPFSGPEDLTAYLASLPPGASTDL